MARYKRIDRNPNSIPVVLDAQLIAGSFKYALEYLIALVLVIVTRFPRCPLRFLTNPDRTGAQNQVHMLQRLKDMQPTVLNAAHKQ